MDLSIIIPTYNRCDLLRKAIESCTDIQGIQFEIIVIDDGSTDGTEDMLQVLDVDVRCCKQQRQGAAVARNKGMSLARGNYIKFLDSDDLLQSNAVVQQLQLAQLKNADLVYGKWDFVSPDNIPMYHRATEQDDLLTFIINSWWVPNFVYLYSSEFLDTHRCLWNEKHLLLDDFHFIVEVLLHSPRIAFTETVIGFYRNHNLDARVSQIDEEVRTRAHIELLDELSVSLHAHHLLTTVQSILIDTKISVFTSLLYHNRIQKIWTSILSRFLAKEKPLERLILREQQVM